MKYLYYIGGEDIYKAFENDSLKLIKNKMKIGYQYKEK